MINGLMVGAVTDPFFGITWAQPTCILFLVVTLGTCFCAIRRLFLFRKRIRSVVPSAREELSVSSLSWRREWWRAVMIIGALLLIQIALLRPQWGEKSEVVEQEGRSIVIALDISRSMAAQDSAPSRLELGKEKIKKLLERLKADQVALVVFSGDALVSCPLTVDYEAFMLLLDDISVETTSSGTTNLTAALGKIEALFAHQTGAGETRLAVLLTDGENFSPGIEAAGEKLKTAGVHLCTIGLGSTDGAPVPLNGKGTGEHAFQKDGAGHVVISCLDTLLLQKIAQATGGKALVGGQDHSELDSLVQWIERFEKKKNNGRRHCALEERYYYYAAGAALLVLLEVLL